MIFLTVGNELPFNRLVRAVDSWRSSNYHITVFGQIGNLGKNDYRPRHFAWQEFIKPDEYHRKCEEAELIIAHAGMGSIITALVTAKPILIMPRRADLHEHRNDHQIATTKRFSVLNGILVAEEETMVETLLEQWETMRGSFAMGNAGPYAQERLLLTIRDFILTGKN